MNVRAGQPAWPLIWAALWLCASSAYLAVLYDPFTPDSYVYVAAAGQALETGRFDLPFAPSNATSVPVPLAAWPPGYPALIALVSATGLDPWVAARCVAATLTFLAIALGALWLARQPGGWTGLALALGCSTTAVISVTAWSEGPFLLALGGAVAAYAILVEAERDRSWLAILGFVVCFACALLIRHAGWFIIPALLWHVLRRPNRRRWIALAAIGLASLPAGLWMWSHTPPGPEAGLTLEPWRILRSTGQTAAAFGKLVVAPWSGPGVWLAVPGALAIGALGLFQWRTRREQRLLSRLLWLVGWSLLFGTWLVGLANPATFFATDRLLWPAWCFLALALGTSLPPVPSRIPGVAFALVLLTQTAGTILTPSLEPRPKSAKQHFQVSHQLLANQIVVSNEPWRAWRLWGARGYYLPRARHGHDVFGPDSLQAWAARRQVGILVWFKDGLTESQSVECFGGLARAGYGKPPAVLELVAEDAICHTYGIRSAGAP